MLLDETTLAALLNSLRFTVLAVALATALGLTHALAARQSLLLRSLVFALCGVTRYGGLWPAVALWTASFGLWVCASALLAYPFVAKSLAADLDGMPGHLAQAARMLRASHWHVFWRMALHLLRPKHRRGMAFAAATAVGEFAVTSFLSRSGTTNRDAALVLACLLMGMAMLAFVVIEWSGDGEELSRA